MALELDVTCSNHQHWKEPRRIRLAVDGPTQLNPQNLKRRIEEHGWGSPIQRRTHGHLLFKEVRRVGPADYDKGE